MDFKAIDIRALNILPSQILYSQEREKPVVKPVKKAGRSRLRSDDREGGSRKDICSEQATSEEEAIYALDVIRDLLSQRPELDAALERDPERNEFFVVICEKDSRHLLRRLRVKEIVTGSMDLFDDLSCGSLIHRTF